MLCTKQGGAVMIRHQGQGRRWMVGKAANRAAVHGSKLPVPDIIPRKEVENEINVAMEEKGRKRMEIENAVDSQIKNWKVLYLEDIVCSK
ncbi:hypothetical protein MIMGU_mgv1a017182mg [Erythranthe guttata]|uniref:Uncharacterized protein n=1 Tax=Erythranthe guttata TaxID=4155 RepID=A0A022PY45_ERYGU|nr:hypothetical protein MIMGU_mgv1a017182mg [Erythranthe guttata]